MPWNCERRNRHDLPFPLDLAPDRPALCRHRDDRRSPHPRPRLRGSVYFSFVHIYRRRGQLGDVLDTRVRTLSAISYRLSACQARLLAVSSWLLALAAVGSGNPNSPEAKELTSASAAERRAFGSCIRPPRQPRSRKAKEVTSASSAPSLLAFFSAPQRLRGDESSAPYTKTFRRKRTAVSSPTSVLSNFLPFSASLCLRDEHAR